MAHERAGQLAQPEDLIDVAELVTAYFTRKPDVNNPDQQVASAPPDTVAPRWTALSTRTTSWQPPRRSSTTATSSQKTGSARCLSAAIRTRCPNQR